MLTRRRFVEYSALSSAMLAYRPLFWGQRRRRSARCAWRSSAACIATSRRCKPSPTAFWWVIRTTANGTCLTCKWSPSMWINWSARPMLRPRPTSLR